MTQFSLGTRLPGESNQFEEMLTLVAEAFDVDPDGAQVSWHRFECPVGANPRDYMPSIFGDVCRIMDIAEFEEKILPELDDFDREYWTEEGYANDGGYSHD